MQLATLHDATGVSGQFCYIVMCHTDPAGTLRLIKRIRALSPEAAVVVRYENRNLLAPDDVRHSGGIPFVSSIQNEWGTWQMVKSLLEVLRFSLDETAADYFVNISGQCYPIRDLQEWEEGVAALKVGAIMEPMPDQPDDHLYRWTVGRFPGLQSDWIQRFFAHVVWRLGRHLPPRAWLYPRYVRGTGPTHVWFGLPRRRRQTPASVPVIRGSTWMCLSKEAVENLLQRSADKGVTSFFKTVRVPDESLFSSLLVTSGLRVAPGIVSARRFEPGASSPNWLTPSELVHYRDSPSPFIRKMPVDADDELLHAADQLVLRRGLPVITD